MRQAQWCWKALAISTWSASSRIRHLRRGTLSSASLVLSYAPAPWHFLNFLPLPQGHGSLRPTPAWGWGGEKPGSGLGRGGGLPLDTRPSAAGFDAVMGPCFLGCPPIGPVTDWLGPPRGGPISICSLSHRSANVVCRSFIKPTNIS